MGEIPRQIAEYLGLPNPTSYTGHSFRRTSATLLANAGADITTLKRHGGWKSSNVAEEYISDSVQNEINISHQITKSVNLESLSSSLSSNSNNSTFQSVKKMKRDEVNSSMTDLKSKLFLYVSVMCIFYKRL